MTVINGNQETISYALYGWDEKRSSYFKDNLNRVYEKVKDTGSNLYKSITNVFNKYHDADVIRRAKDMLRRENGFTMNEDEYVSYTDPRIANRRMRDYVMSHIDVSTKYEKGILDGYSETDTKYDRNTAIMYRNLANDGVYNDNGDVTNYWLIDGADDLDIERLSIDEQYNIHVTWASISRMLSKDIDPTNKI